MSQNSLIIADGNGAAVLAAINAALDTLKTVNAGVAAPSAPSAFMVWADLSTGKMKMRNASNNSWVTLWDLSTGLMGNTSGILQTKSYNPAPVSATTAIASVSTLPTITSGTEVATLNITPSSANSKIRISLCGQLILPTSTDYTGTLFAVPGALAFFRDSTCIASFRYSSDTTSAGLTKKISDFVVDNPTTTNTITYSVRYMNVAYTQAWHVGSTASSNQGGSWKSSYVLEEITG